MHNERLEYLGDAVVDLVVGDRLMQCLPDAREGTLSKLRALVVSEASLAGVAGALGLGQFLSLGRGEEQTGGRAKPSLLADAFEAVIGAVYRDGGFDAANQLALRLLGQLVADAVSGRLKPDHKTRLQEFAQGKLRQMPHYEVVDERGPDHEKEFEVAVSIAGQEIARACGHSKKEAEREAAGRALARLEADAAGPPSALDPAANT